MPCDEYETYVGNGSNEHLDKLKVEVLQNINEALGIEPSFGIPRNDLFNKKHTHFNRPGPYTIVTPNTKSLIHRFFEGSARIYEFDDLT